MHYVYFIANLAVITLLVFWLYKRSLVSPLKRFFWPALILKLSAGILLGLVYRYYYEGGDTWQYFREATRIASIAEVSFWDYLKELFANATAYKSQFIRQPRALFISKITSGFVLLTGANYWLIAVYFSLFSFVGFWLLAQRLAEIVRNKLGVILSVLFFPSVVFWSAGLSKESLAMSALAILSYYLLTIIYTQTRIKWIDILLAVVSFILLWKIKYYYAGVFILAFGSGFLVYLICLKSKLFRRRVVVQLLSFLLILMALSLAVSFTSYNFHFNHLPDIIVKNYEAYLQKSSPEKMVVFDGLQNTWSSLSAHSPKALFSGLFRPLPGEGAGVLSVFAGMENIILLVLSVSALFGLPVSLTYKERILLISSLLFISVLAVFLTLSSPNFGTLVRYRVGFLPAFLLIVTLKNPLIKRLNQWAFGE